MIQPGWEQWKSEVVAFILKGDLPGRIFDILDMWYERSQVDFRFFGWCCYLEVKKQGKQISG